MLSWKEAPRGERFLLGALLLLVALFAVALFPTSTGLARVQPALPAVATSTPACGLAWREVDIPSLPGSSELDAVAGLSPSDVWAVGSYGDGIVTQTLTLHWDSGQWSIVPSPNDGTTSVLSAVAAPKGYQASNGIWAVGYSGTRAASHTLIEHWDGTQWSIVPSPDEVTGTNILDGVAFAGDNDVWAVGYSGSTPNYRTLVEHWDGGQWSIVPSPNDGTGDNLLHAVTATGPGNVWAVGTHYQTNIGLLRTTTMNWNGSAWSLVTSLPSYGNNYFFGVFAVAPNDTWAVGGEEDMLEHWNGTSWGGVGPVVPGDLHSVSASTQNDVWAVGDITVNGYSPIYHFDGSNWFPFSANSGTYLRGVVAISRDAAWAVGYGGSGHALVEQYSDPCASPTGTPPATRTSGPTNTATVIRTSTVTRTSVPTSTPTVASTFTPIATVPSTTTPGAITPTSTFQPTAIPTSTLMPALTRTPTATVTVVGCLLNLTDVHPGDYFYDAVQQMFCAGVVSGYADNSFRPYSSASRGQICKIVTMFLGMPINTQGGPHFSDVLISNPFYSYIETAYNAGLVSGYSDGTFRWNDYVSRGQICKIVVNGYGWPVYTPRDPTFSDVSVGSPFYVYAETAVYHRIITGYANGTFRPGSNATRGQVCKIVYSGLNPFK